MKKLLNGLQLKGEFVKNAFTLTIGTSIAQAFPILLYPILGRIFQPAEFGLLATLSSITSILTVLATGKYESSILITRTKKDAANVVGLVLLLSSSFLIISFLVLQLFSNDFSEWFNEPKLKIWLFVCPISALSIIIFNCYNEWCVRNKYFVSLSWNKITNSASTTLSKLFFGLVKISSNGLVIGDLTGRLISAGSCIFRGLQKDKNAFLQISLNRMSVLSKRYMEFPKYLLPDQLFDTLNSQLPTLIIAYFFLSTKVGYYAMAGNVLSVPASIISVAVRDVFRQRANEEWIRIGNCKNIYNKVVRMMLLVIVPTSIGLMLILPDLFSLLLGKNWRIAGIYARILMPNVAILFMFQVVEAVFVIANKMKASFFWQIYSIALTITSLFIGCFMFKDINRTLICYVIARCIANLTRFYMTYNYSKGIEMRTIPDPDKSA
jgi:O-antigen/teichoic acid export membrane protein